MSYRGFEKKQSARDQFERQNCHLNIIDAIMRLAKLAKYLIRNTHPA
jgi:hypothetical protein